MEEFRLRRSAKVIGFADLVLNSFTLLVIILSFCVVLFSKEFERAVYEADIDFDKVRGIVICFLVISALFQALMIVFSVKLIKATTFGRSVNLGQARGVTRCWLGLQIFFVVLNFLSLFGGIWLSTFITIAVRVPMIIIVHLFGRELDRAIQYSFNIQYAQPATPVITSEIPGIHIISEKCESRA